MAGKPVSQAGADIGRRVAAIGLAASKARNDSVRAALFTAKRIHEGVIARDSGGDMRLSGVGARRGRPGNAKVGARFKMTGDGRGEIGATGPMHFLERSTSPHRISTAYRSRGRGPIAVPTGGRKAVINIPGIGYRRHADHPGTRGKRTWSKGKALAEKPIRTTMSKATLATIAGAFKAT